MVWVIDFIYLFYLFILDVLYTDYFRIFMRCSLHCSVHVWQHVAGHT